MLSQMGRLLLVFGAVIMLVGFVLISFPRIGAFFGSLPGDIKTDGVFFPITSMVVISALLTLVLNLALWVLRNFFTR